MSLAGGKSLTLRLTFLFASVSTTVLLLLGLLIGALVERHFQDLDMELLNGKLELVRHALGGARSGADIDALPGQLREALVGHPGLAVIMLALDGKILFSTEGAGFLAPLAARAANGGKLRPAIWSAAGKPPFRAMGERVTPGFKGAPPVIVAVATDLTHHQHFNDSFHMTLWSVMGVAALVTGLLGWGAARTGLAPLRDIKRRADGVTADRLDQRLPVDAIPVELADVAKTFNDMFARLEHSFKRLSDFSSDLAHELRAPVANLLTQTQVTLVKARTIGQYQDVLASNAEEFERLSRMIADMLFLAKSENSLIVPHREAVDLGREVSALFDFYALLADEKHISLTCLGAGFASGDRLMLRRALGNLLSNAVRHTPAGGRITVRLTDGRAGAGRMVAVENTGPSIPAQHLPRLFDRFYRADSARRHLDDGGGVGLGLAIVRSIARAHGGEASVHSADGVTIFEICLPG